MANGVGTTHHVKINGEFFLIKNYQKSPAPTFGARFTTGDPDYNNLSFWQHWVQRCWIGGFDAPEWQDDAMFDKSSGVDTSYHEVLLLSRDLGPDGASRTSDNWALSAESGGAYERKFFTWNGQDDSGTEGLYCLTHGAKTGTSSWLHRYRNATSDWVLVKEWTHASGTARVRSFARWRNRMYFGHLGTNLTIMQGNPGSETFTTLAKPSGNDSNGAAFSSHVPYVMRAFRDRFYVAFGQSIWRLKSDNTWDGSTVFYEAPDVNYLTAMEPHLGFLYISSQNGHILRTDGNNTFDMWSMEADTRIDHMRSFDGRLFLSCTDPLEGTRASEAVLFQFSGAAVTELKRLGKIGVESRFGALRAIGSRLFFGAPSLFGFEDGFGISMYDVVEDSYHVFGVNNKTSTYTAGSEQINWNVDDVIWYKGYLYCSVRGWGLFRTKYTVRDVSNLLATYNTTKSGGSIGSKNGGWLESSEFDAGTPGLQKLWNNVKLFVDLPTTDTSVYVEYSLDGGNTWAHAGTATKTGAGRRYELDFKLGSNADGGVYGASFKYRLTLRTVDSARSPAVRGIIVRYLPVPEPNWRWNMTLLMSDKQELLDGTTDTPNNATKRTALETPFREQSLVKFTDIDGVQWNASGSGPGALISSLRVRAPFIGPSSGGALEYEIDIELTEAVEAYENP